MGVFQDSHVSLYYQIKTIYIDMGVQSRELSITILGFSIGISFLYFSTHLNLSYYMQILFIAGFVLSLLIRLLLINSHQYKVYLVDVLITGLTVLYICKCFSIHQIVNSAIPLVYALFYFGLRLNKISVSPDENIFVAFALLAVACHSFISILQWMDIIQIINSHSLVSSTFDNPDKLASFIAILLPAFYGRKFSYRNGVLLFSFAEFIFLEARTAIIASLVSWVGYFTLRYRLKFKNLIILSIIFVPVGFILISWHTESFYGRVFIWLTSIYMMWMTPSGWGLNAFMKDFPEIQYNIAQNYPQIAASLNVDLVYSPFNEFFNVGVTLGVFALALFFLICLLVAYMALRIKSIFFFSILSYLIICLSYCPFHIPSMTCFIIVLCASVVNQFEQNNRTCLFIIHSGCRFFVKLGVLSLSIILILSVYAFSNWFVGNNNMNLGIYEEALTYYKKAYPFCSEDGVFVSDYASLHCSRGEYAEAYKEWITADRYFSSPNICQNLSILAENSRHIEESKQWMQKAVSLSPKDFKIRGSYILLLWDIGDSIEARNQIDILYGILNEAPDRNKEKLDALKDFEYNTLQF